MTIPESLHNTRLDNALADLLAITRSQAKKMIDEERITVNGTLPKKSGDIVSVGDRLVVLREVTQEKTEGYTEVSIDTSVAPIILTETDDYLVIDKPAGLLTHPTEADEPWSLAHWIWQTYPNLTGVGEYENRPGIVHRLDKDTSGALVIAKTQAMFEELKTQFKHRTVEKIYTTLVHGSIQKDTDIIDFDIDRGSGGRMVARPKQDQFRLKHVGKEQPGKPAKTEFFVRARYARYTLLDVHIYSGRTHQIRVHLFAYNHPVVGDTLYVQNKRNRTLDAQLGRLFLHANTLAFDDMNGERISITAPLPVELQRTLDTLA